MPQEAVLSCESCTRRKIKCDKQLPTCSNCERFGIKCNPVSRQRLPRGRNGGRKKADDSELRARLARLESLVKTMEAAGVSPNESSTSTSPPPPTASSLQNGSQQPLPQPLPNQPQQQQQQQQQQQPQQQQSTFQSPCGWPKQQERKSPTGSTSSPPISRTTTGSSLPRPDKKSFWATFEDEVAGLRQILETEDSDEEIDNSDPLAGALDIPTGAAISSAVASNLFMLQSGSFIADPSILQQPPQSMVNALCDVYIERVDFVFKLLHAPSLRLHLQQGQPYLNTYSADEPAVKALRFSIFFAAVNSMSETECINMFFQERSALMARLRLSAEVALAQADLICARTIEVLQALVIYLAAIRLNDARPTSWALIALAMRLARGLGIHQELSIKRFNTFHAEMCRRTWWTICVLDTLTSKDRGSEPIFCTQQFDTKAPALINDSDLPGPDYNGPLEDRQEYTDLTQFSLTRETAHLASKMNASWGTDDIWPKRQEVLAQYEITIRTRYLSHCNPSVPREGFTLWTGSAIMANIFLVAYRPIQDHCTRKVKGSGPSLLAAAINVLERATMAPEPYKRWSWWSWIQWHALAVALSELCISEEGPLLDKAWPIVEFAFQYYSGLIGDSKAVVMWRPVEKLHARAVKRRRGSTKTDKFTEADLNLKALDLRSFPDRAMTDIHPANPSCPVDDMNAQFQLQQQQHQAWDYGFNQQHQHPFSSTEQNNSNRWMSSLLPEQPFIGNSSSSDMTDSPDDSWMQFVSEYIDATAKDTLPMQTYDTNVNGGFSF